MYNNYMYNSYYMPMVEIKSGFRIETLVPILYKIQ